MKVNKFAKTSCCLIYSVIILLMLPINARADVWLCNGSMNEINCDSLHNAATPIQMEAPRRGAALDQYNNLDPRTLDRFRRIIAVIIKNENNGVSWNDFANRIIKHEKRNRSQVTINRVFLKKDGWHHDGLTVAVPGCAFLGDYHLTYRVRLQGQTLPEPPKHLYVNAPNTLQLCQQ